MKHLPGNMHGDLSMRTGPVILPLHTSTSLSSSSSYSSMMPNITAQGRLMLTLSFAASIFAFITSNSLLANLSPFILVPHSNLIVRKVQHLLSRYTSSSSFSNTHHNLPHSSNSQIRSPRHFVTSQTFQVHHSHHIPRPFQRLRAPGAY